MGSGGQLLRGGWTRAEEVRPVGAGITTMTCAFGA